LEPPRIFAKPRLVFSATVQETRQIVNTVGASRTSEVVAFSNGPLKHLALTLPHFLQRIEGERFWLRWFDEQNNTIHRALARHLLIVLIPDRICAIAFGGISVSNSPRWA
jgi:hypothetical protein